jgi:hypothetical protein
MKLIISFLALAFVLFFSSGASAQDPCLLCQLSVQYITGYLKQNYTQEQIVKQLQVVCALAPSPLKEQCDKFLEDHVPYLIQYILENETPSVACAHLGFCPPYQLEDPTVPDLEKFPTVVDDRPETPDQEDFPVVVTELMQPMDADLACSVCQLFLNKIQDFLQSNMTVDQITQLLNQVCHTLPVNSQQCSQLVETYVPSIIKFLLSNANPEAACQNVGLCPETMDVQIPEVAKPNPKLFKFN